MQSKLVLLASVTGALAITDLSGSLPQKYARALDSTHDLAARDDTEECLSVAGAHTSITADFPLPPTQLLTATDYVDIPTVTDACDFPLITGSVGQVITSYSAAVQSWQDKHITALRSMYSACSDVPIFSEVVAQLGGDAICSTAWAPFTSGASATVTVTPTAVSTVTGVVSEASSTATVTVAPSSSETDDAEETTAAATGTDATASGAEQTNTSFNAAPRETGMVMAAAAAAAGIVGAVML